MTSRKPDFKEQLTNSVFRIGIEEAHILNPLKFSLIITILYIILISAYIWYSGAIALYFSKTKEDLALIELVKGLTFVIVTAAVLFFYIYHTLKKIEYKNNIIMAQNKSIISSERLVMAGLFSTSVSHDINNLMFIITGSADLMYSSKTLDANNMQLLENISSSSKKLVELSRSMMDASKEYLPGEMKTEDLSKIVESTVSFSKIHSKLKRCNIVEEIQSDIIMNINSILIGRTLMNLLLNSADATNETGKILIRLKEVSQNVLLEVHDDGPGINDDLKEKVLEPFYTTKQDGNGLGLLSLKICALQHNGKIAIKKSDLGGACFSISFPINDTYNSHESAVNH